MSTPMSHHPLLNEGNNRNRADSTRKTIIIGILGIAILILVAVVLLMIMRMNTSQSCEMNSLQNDKVF